MDFLIWVNGFFRNQDGDDRSEDKTDQNENRWQSTFSGGCDEPDQQLWPFELVLSVFSKIWDSLFAVPNSSDRLQPYSSIPSQNYFCFIRLQISVSLSARSTVYTWTSSGSMIVV